MGFRFRRCAKWLLDVLSGNNGQTIPREELSLHAEDFGLLFGKFLLNGGNFHEKIQSIQWKNRRVVYLNLVAEAADPSQDTWVLRWDGYDYYVKAGSLEYTPGHPDVAPEFSYDVAQFR